MPNITIATIGLDISKHTVHVAGLDPTGHPVLKRRMTHRKLLQFLANTPKALVAMEACPGSNYLARQILRHGHDARLIPAHYVKPYVKTNKNDYIDAEAIAEAATRPTMRCVPIKTTEQLDLQTMHRVRDRLVYQRTSLICQIRSFLLEYGVVMGAGVAAFKRDYPRVIAENSDRLTPRLRLILERLRAELSHFEDLLESASNEIAEIANRDDRARRLMTVPGIGALTATALVASVGDARRFHSGRDLAAWLGLVPRQYSSGGKPTLLSISKRGNSYLRRLLIHGARSCVLHLHRRGSRLGEWLDELEARAHRNKAVVALANKLARIAWALLTDPSRTYKRTPTLAAAPV